MTALAPPPAVTDYANAVRAHLGGLDVETLDELTGGLEADLAEAVAERVPDGGAPDLVSVTEVFGSPVDYAEELRTAAGVELPATGTAGRPRLRTLVAKEIAGFADDWQRWRAEYLWLGGVVDFLVSLRPAWWLLRAWVLFHLFTGLRNTFVGSGPDVLLLGVLVVLSVLWGQKRLGQRRWWRRVGLLASAIALIAALPTLANLYQRTVWPSYAASGYDQGYTDGRWAAQQEAAHAAGIAGTPSNLFVYGPDGQPIEDAQIVDQAGNPVVLTDPWTGAAWTGMGAWDWRGDAIPVPVLEDNALNVYPWRYLAPEHMIQRDDGTVFGHTTFADDPRWPAAMLFPVPGFEPTDAVNEVSTEATDEPSTAPADEPSESPAQESRTEPSEGSDAAD